MRKLLTLCLCLCAALNLSAQEKKDKHLFNHLGAGVGVGTSGVSVDVAMPCTRFLQVRAGVDIMPNISFDADVDYSSSLPQNGQPDEITLTGKFKRVQGHFILNVYPIPKTYVPDKFDHLHLSWQQKFNARHVKTLTILTFL